MRAVAVFPVAPTFTLFRLKVPFDEKFRVRALAEILFRFRACPYVDEFAVKASVASAVDPVNPVTLP